TEEDIERIKLLRISNSEAAPDQGTGEDGVEQPGVVAAAELESSVDLDALTGRLISLDDLLRAQLETAVLRDMETALQRLGAQCRTKLRQEGPGAYTDRGLSSAVKNVDLPFALGLDRVRDLGLDPRASLTGSLLSLTDWWQHEALPGARESVNAALEPLGVSLSAANGEYAASATALVNGVVDWLLEELGSENPRRPSAPPADV